MNAAGIQARWGIPDWTRAEDYPDPVQITDRVWRWEFRRRQLKYREKWNIARSNADPKDHFARDGHWLVVDRENHHRMLAAPQCALSDELIADIDRFNEEGGHIV
jgi:hypothetical protein